jgi:hypothetical protein
MRDVCMCVLVCDNEYVCVCVFVCVCVCVWLGCTRLFDRFVMPLFVM